MNRKLELWVGKSEYAITFISTLQKSRHNIGILNNTVAKLEYECQNLLQNDQEIVVIFLKFVPLLPSFSETADLNEGSILYVPRWF